MGRMDVLSNGLDNKKLDANSSGLSPGRDMNGPDDKWHSAV